MYIDKYKNRGYKYYHSIRVMNNMRLLSKLLNLPYKDIELASCIGLLHDIAKLDSKEEKQDHGWFAVELIKKDNILSNFDIDHSDYEVVYKAIANHNKYLVDNNLNKRELLFTTLLRDADKLDIIYALSNKDIKPVLIQDNSMISKPVSDIFYQNKIINRNICQNKNDNLINIFSFVFDINYTLTLKIIDKYKYYDKICERIDNLDIFKPYIDYINNYIKERIG